MIDSDVLLDYTRAHADDLKTLRRLERAAVAHVEEKTGYQWRLGDDVVDVVHRRGDIIPLSAIPVDGVLDSLESWDGSAWSAVDSGAYYVDGSHIRLHTSGFTFGPFPTRFRATYPGGYAQSDDSEEIDAPENVKQAVLMYVTYWFDNRDGLDYEQLERAASALLAPMTRQTI